MLVREVTTPGNRKGLRPQNTRESPKKVACCTARHPKAEFSSTGSNVQGRDSQQFSFAPDLRKPSKIRFHKKGQGQPSPQDDVLIDMKRIKHILAFFESHLPVTFRWIVIASLQSIDLGLQTIFGIGFDTQHF